MGEDMPLKGRDLMLHFQSHGSPVMVGGNNLAHTILGVVCNEHTGEVHWLILDPHFTGAEDINVVQNKGWCAWKGSNFWNPRVTYNMCLPLRPSGIF